MNITCEICKQRLYPDNPEVSTRKRGKFPFQYSPPMCWSCSNYRPDKTLERVEPVWVKEQWDVVGSLRGQMIHLEKKVIEQYNYARKKEEENY